MKKLFLTLVSIIMLVIALRMPAMATTTILDPGSYNIPVTADITPVFQVTLPNSIYITERQIKEFDITLEGTTKRSETLFVNIPSTITMTQNDKNVELDLTMDKNSFLYSDLDDGGTTTKCRIDASSLPSGNWVGTLDVEVQLKDFELPTGLELDSLVIAYRDSQGRTIIETTSSDLSYSYNSNTDYLGRYASDRYSKVFTEQPDGSYVMSQSRISTNKIKVSEIDLIYSNYDIPYSTSGIWFENTVFN